jgi:hypothetical protein
MTVADFIAKWGQHELKERSAAFERGAAKATGGDGCADV